MSNRNILRIICVGLFLLILISMHAWFFLWMDNIHVAVFECILIAIMSIYITKNKKSSSKNRLYIYAALSLFLVGLLNRSGSFVHITGVALVVSIMYLLMRFPQEAKIKILQFSTKWLSLLLLVSVSAWLLHFFISLPSYGNVYYLDFSGGGSVNYIFFTELASSADIRFKSVFLEPGHVSIVAAFLVIANRFNLKNKYVLLLMLEIIPTFGLAGYMLYIIGYLFYSIESNQMSFIFTSLMLGTFIAVSAAYGFSSYKGGDNMFNDEERGIAGNDRSNYIVDEAFKKAWEDGSIVLGLPKSEYERVQNMGAIAAGMKPYMLEHGIIGTFFLFLGYFLVSRTSVNKRWATFLFWIYVISFLQRAYFFWAGYYIPYICGIVFYVKNLEMMGNENHKR